jgi:hypothetical protein
VQVVVKVWMSAGKGMGKGVGNGEGAGEGESMGKDVHWWQGGVAQYHPPPGHTFIVYF